MCIGRDVAYIFGSNERCIVDASHVIHFILLAEAYMCARHTSLLGQLDWITEWSVQVYNATQPKQA